MKQPLAALLLIIIASASTLATPPEIPARFAFSLRPARSARPPGPVDLEYLCAKTKYASDSIGIMQFRVENPEDVRLLSAATWTADMTVRDTVRHIVTVDVQPTDTVFIRVTGASRWLWIENDTLAHGHMRPAPAGTRHVDPDETIWAQYTESELQEVHDFSLDLKNVHPRWLEANQSQIGPPVEPVGPDSVYHGRATKKTLINLLKRRIPIRVTLPPPSQLHSPGRGR